MLIIPVSNKGIRINLSDVINRIQNIIPEINMFLTNISSDAKQVL